MASSLSTQFPSSVPENNFNHILGTNPRRAATRLKEKQQQIEMMRNRFKVLEGHDQYQRYRTIDQERRIDYHYSIHDRISKEKEELKVNMAAQQETTEIRNRNTSLRNSIREGLEEARRSLRDNRTERSQLISQQLKEYEKQIHFIKKEDLEYNKSRTIEVKRDIERKRQRVREAQEQKILSTMLNKSRDSRILITQTDKLDQEYALMMEYQKRLLEENNKSMQASQVVRGRYDRLMSGRRLLPGVEKDRKSTTTDNSDPATN